MKRKALIIGSSPSSDYLSGVSRDVMLWKTFLTSPFGGGWVSPEIEILREPTIRAAQSASQRLEEADYCLLVFIGHGFMKNDEMGIPVTYMKLNENEVISERNLNPKTPWFLEIMDCCRMYTPYEVLHESIKNASKTTYFSLSTVRQNYEQAIRIAEKGWVRIYAADIHQGASDECSFSNVLLYLISEWCISNHGILDTNEAHQLVSKHLKKSNPQQTPVHQAGRRMHYFPIGVGAK